MIGLKSCSTCPCPFFLLKSGSLEANPVIAQVMYPRAALRVWREWMEQGKALGQAGNSWSRNCTTELSQLEAEGLDICGSAIHCL